MVEHSGGQSDGPEGPEGQERQPGPAIAARTDDGRVILVTPDGMAVEGAPDAPDAPDAPGAPDAPDASGDEEDDAAEGSGEDRPSVTEMVAHPDKVMRIGTMTRSLLAELKAAPLDEGSRQRLRDIHRASIEELKEGISDELAEELERLAQPFEEETPSEAELRIAQAQLVGWLEGLFQGIQTTLYAQQMASRAQLEQMRRALPGSGGGRDPESSGPGSSGMYL